tara:strand:+ start:69 stop:497 length:429 start_codon:yes stop_codon:yes gene_type:complete
MIRKAITAIGYAISYLLILQPSLAETDTCTQGGPDGYAAALIATSLLGVISLPAIIQGISLRSRIHLLGLFHIMTLIVFLYKVAPVVFQTNIGGVHICGGHFGYASYREEYLYAPVLFIALFSLLLSSSVGIQKWAKGRDFA